jgi:hypothetical protein
VLAELLERRVGNPLVEEVFPGKAFDYLGIAQPRVVPPTPTSPPPPTATPEPRSDIYLPSVSNNP